MLNPQFRKSLDVTLSDRPARLKRMPSDVITAMPLDELRKARKFTHDDLAQNLGVNQREVSRIENRTDLYLSTLAEFVGALGGSLEIRAIFPDSDVRLTQLEGLR